MPVLYLSAVTLLVVSLERPLILPIRISPSRTVNLACGSQRPNTVETNMTKRRKRKKRLPTLRLLQTVGKGAARKSYEGYELRRSSRIRSSLRPRVSSAVEEIYTNGKYQAIMCVKT